MRLFVCVSQQAIEKLFLCESEAVLCFGVSASHAEWEVCVLQFVYKANSCLCVCVVSKQLVESFHLQAGKYLNVIL